MLVIFSGVDRVGKTTLAKKVSVALGIPYIKFDMPKAVKMEDPLLWARDIKIFHNSILQFVKRLYDCKARINVIIDRFYPDEIVYSAVFRNIDLFEEYREIDFEFARIGTKLIYVCLPKYSILKQRWKEESKVGIEYTASLAWKFEEFGNFTELPILIVHQDTDIQEILNFCKDDKE